MAVGGTGVALRAHRVCRFVAPAEIAKMELEQEASTAVSRIGAELNQEPSALIDAFARPRIAPHLGQIFDKLGYDHRVLRYELYNPAGNLIFMIPSPDCQSQGVR
ncbi:MAG TPA: hypothetical protein VKD00_02135 [Methyloceanibacter sp.]|nr:hypothetical protein [Methyloceanibacter sp.]